MRLYATLSTDNHDKYTTLSGIFLTELAASEFKRLNESRHLDIKVTPFDLHVKCDNCWHYMSEKRMGNNTYQKDGCAKCSELDTYMLPHEWCSRFRQHV